MIKFNLFFHRFLGASGSLGYDGHGWWHPKYWFLRLTLMRESDLLIPIIKTITLNPRKGHLKAIYDGPNFVVNAVGLINPGFEDWVGKYGQKIKWKFILSIAAEDLKELLDFADKIAEFKKENNNLIGIEFNCSCPNLETEFHRSAKKVNKAVLILKEKVELPVSVKIGYVQKKETYLAIAKKTENLISWISFNSIPWEMVFKEESPLMKKFSLTGAVSRAKIRQLNKNLALAVKKEKIKTPLIASSVGWGKTFEEGYQDLLEAFTWADAVSFGSLFRRHPLWPVKLIRRYQKEKEQKKIPAIGAPWLRE